MRECLIIFCIIGFFIMVFIGMNGDLPMNHYEIDDDIDKHSK